MFHEQALAAAETSSNNNGSVNFDGTWTNQMGSTMVLQVNGTDVIGSYTSRTSAQAGGGSVTGPVKGNAKGDLVSFLVLWPSGSMTAWTGQMVDENGTEKIRTLWNLVTEIPNQQEPDYFWKSTFAGADEFTRAV